MRGLELRIQEQVRRNENSAYWLESLARFWDSKLSELVCEKCGSNASWVDVDKYECPNGHEGESYHLRFEAWEAGVPSWFANKLTEIGVLRITYKSSRNTEYSFTQEGYKAVTNILGGAGGYVEGNVTAGNTVDTDLFDDIIGLEKVKIAIVKALNSDKPVHVLLAGPPACIDGDEKVLTWNPDTGEVIPKRASEIYEEFEKGSIPYVLTFTGETLTVMPALVVKAGSKKIFRVKTPIGNVMVSEEHTLFTSKNKTVKLAELKKGDKLLSVGPIPRKWIGYGGRNSVPYLWKAFPVVVQPRSASSQDADRGIQKDVPKHTVDDRGCDETYVRESQQSNERVLEQGHRRGKEEERENKTVGEKTEETSYNDPVPSMWQVVRDVYKRWEVGEKVLLAIVLSEGEQREVKENEYREQPGEETGGEGKDIVKNKNVSSTRPYIHTKVIGNRREGALGEVEAKPREIQEVYRVPERACEEGVHRDRQVERGRINVNRDEEELHIKIREENEQNTGKPWSDVRVERTIKDTSWHEVSGFPDIGAEEGYNRGGRSAPREKGVGGERHEERSGVHADGVLGVEILSRGSGKGTGESETTNIKSTSRIWYRVPILEIEELGVRESYDLIVPYYHNFIVESGIVVHNSAKSMILERIAKRYGVEILLGGTSTRAGLRDYIAERTPELLLIDEIDKVSDTMDLSVLLSWMWHQKVTIVMHKRKETVSCPTVCKVIAAANYIEKLPRELLSRFTIIEIPPYTDEEMWKICVNEAKNEGLDEELAKTVAEAVIKDMKSRDPRDCVKLARMKPKNVEEVKLLAETIGLKSRTLRTRA